MHSFQEMTAHISDGQFCRWYSILLVRLIDWLWSTHKYGFIGHSTSFGYYVEPDRPFYKFGASKSVARCSWTTYYSWSWGSKTEKGSVGKLPCSPSGSCWATANLDKINQQTTIQHDEQVFSVRSIGCCSRIRVTENNEAIIETTGPGIWSEVDRVNELTNIALDCLW